MARCCNCGINISSDDKTKLCDGCKKIILPFVKFMDVSTSSAVRRLVTNERNLRNAGVTDSGMDYLLRICELHDKKKMQEKKEREDARKLRELDEQLAKASERAPKEENTEYIEAELPMEEPLDLCRNPYGGLLGAAQVLLVILGVALVAMFAVKLIMNGEFQVSCILSGAVALISAYVAYASKKIIRDLEEIKKYFR